jgi:hypothetical protein
MSSYIDMYFEQFKNRLTDKHKQDITNMYDNIHVCNYDEVFGPTDLSFNTSKSIIFREHMNIRSPIIAGITKGTLISRDKSDRIYKVNICRNDENKNLFILNFLREIYFQKTFRDILIKEGITSIIVPEVYRYGIIYNNETNDVVIFMEMHMYDFTECFIQTIIDTKPTYKAKLETIQLYARKHCNDIVILSDLEKKYNLYHNDNVSRQSIESYIFNSSIPLSYNSPPETNQEDVENKCKEFITNDSHMVNYIFGGNLFNSINKTILIDFEDASASSYPNDIYFFKSYLSIIIKKLIFTKGI